MDTQAQAENMTATQYLAADGTSWTSPLGDIIDGLTEWYGFRRPHLDDVEIAELAEEHAARCAK